MQNYGVNKADTGRRPGSAALGWGVVLVILGVVLLGLNTGFIPAAFKRIVFSVQTLLVLLGVVECARRHYKTGAVLVVVGLFFMMPKLARIYPDLLWFVTDNFTRVFWPVIFIVAGFAVIFSVWRRSSRGHRGGRPAASADACCGQAGYYRRSMVFGNVELTVLDREFRGADLDTVFGRIVLDLRNTTLPEGETVVDVSSVFGSVVILAPAGWMVVTEFDNVFGSFTDHRPTLAPQHPERVLFVKGACVFGSGEIRNMA